MPSRWFALAAVAALLPLAGCTGDMTGNAVDTSVEKDATFTVTNEEDATVRLRAESAVGGEQVDVTYRVFTANRTAELTLGLPAQGNTVITLTREDTGRELTFTFAMGSCANLRGDIVMADEGVHSRELTCT